MITVARLALQEAVRRRVFVVVAVLSVFFVGLYWVGIDFVFEELPASGVEQVEIDVVASATLFGLAMFGTLFLGTILAVFLTLGAVRGDAERGLLQPLVVRPLGRHTFLFGRFLGAAVVCTAYVLAVYAATMVATRAASGGWWPDQVLLPALELAAGVVILAALSLLGSVLLSPVANGIAIFMLFGAGLVAGLLGQIGDVLQSDTLQSISRKTSWALPYEALYQDALYRITADTHGLTEFVLRLGPFGGAEVGGSWLPLWAAAYLVLAGSVAVVAFARKDL
ncbi:MAG: ABC transporter permease subunit [Actinomycetota bacterium]|nr:ABC transporter permease subunit [Actinomycetota bacterium]